ncbi:MAG: DUF3465 domain-containing protein [Xanthomonadales bacterium]|nr:DUF3465 domain-containing protein [Xanthomonadales bacterium]
MQRITKMKGLGWAALLVAALLWRQFGPGLPTETALGDGGMAELYARKQSDIMVEFEARVDRILPDDINGTPHQRFILELDNGHTVLVAHNLDLAERVALQEWDLVKIRGEYEYNLQGGVVHWTHRDPGMGIKHGWIEHKGQRYQ